jgi:thiol-disulfide isomerase/thioredoxin
MTVRLPVLTLILAAAASAEAGTIVQVAGRVVDAKGNPVAGARIAELWFAEQAGPLEPNSPALSGKDGRFSLEMELYDRDTLVMAIDATGTLGGVATLSAKTAREPIQIALMPLAEVRVRYVSESPGRSLGETYVTMFAAGGRLRVAAGRSRAAEFRVNLPPGRYSVRGKEGRHLEDVREITLAPGMAVDLGEINLQLSPMAQLFGKPAPAWTITDARGVSKEIQPADFKGKWVVLEFWGYWCGPCIYRGLPGWMEFVDDHAADSDKFVVLAVHDPQATDFAMLDEKLEPIIRRTWHGRSLPFPILLDTSGRMAKDYGIDGWPTAILLDPEGRVVDVPPKRLLLGSWACEDYLASKLTPLPAAKRLARALDRGLSVGRDEDTTLAESLSFYGTIGRTTIRLDRDELKAAGIDEDARVPLKLSGTLTLRAWLNLTLEPFGLTYVADGDGLRVVRRSPENLELSQPSPKQVAENALITAALKEKVTLEFQRDSLKQVVATLESKTGESFVLDPVCRKLGTINPESVVTGSAVDEPLSSVLPRLLAPLGMTFAVHNEAIVLTIAH